jgi:hypothetical protein
MPESASGRAFLARQQAASQELGSVFDSLRAWTHAVFELDWLCIRQYWTEEKWLRVSDDQELTGYRFVALNRQVTRAQRLQELLEKQVPPDKALGTAAGSFAPIIMSQVQRQAAMMAQAQQVPPEGQEQLTQALLMQHPLMAETVTENQVEGMLVDIVVDEAPETAILAQEEFETLSQLLPTVAQAKPELAGTMVRLMIKASNLPDKRALMQEMDKGPDPQAMQMQEQQAQLQMAGVEANVRKTAAQAGLAEAQTQKTAAEAQMLGPKTEAEVGLKQAQAMSHAASAGQRAAGPSATMEIDPEWQG